MLVRQHVSRIQATNLSAVLADHKIAELTMMDFKHATISTVLSQIVERLALDIE